MKYFLVSVLGLYALSPAFAEARQSLAELNVQHLHSAQYQEGIQGLTERADGDLQSLAEFEVEEEDANSDVWWWVWNPISGSLTSGCWTSGCGGSGCGGSGCIFSGCGVSGCGGSGCASSDCEASLCGGSDCEGSVCIGSDCEGSVCVGSACNGTVCMGSGCQGSVCQGSNCANSMCSQSGCPTQNNCPPGGVGSHFPNHNRIIVAAELDRDVMRLATAVNGDFVLRYVDASGAICEAQFSGSEGRIVEVSAFHAVRIVSIEQRVG